MSVFETTIEDNLQHKDEARRAYDELKERADDAEVIMGALACVAERTLEITEGHEDGIRALNRRTGHIMEDMKTSDLMVGELRAGLALARDDIRTLYLIIAVKAIVVIALLLIILWKGWCA